MKQNYKINDDGAEWIDEWSSSYEKKADRPRAWNEDQLRMMEWCSKAEILANRQGTANVELCMSEQNSVTGCLETLVLGPEHFDVIDNTEGE